MIDLIQHRLRLIGQNLKVRNSAFARECVQAVQFWSLANDYQRKLRSAARKPPASLD
jgi:hypothetical protein